MNRMSRTVEIAFLLALVASACVVQCVVIGGATVPALDAVRFVRSAQLLSQAGLFELIRSAPDAPLFVLWVTVVHAVLVALVGDFREIWACSAQIAAAVPLVLLPLAAYGLGRCLVAARTAMFGAALLAFLPELVRLGGDGISDTTHLFLLSLAMWMLAAVLSARVMGSRAGLSLAVLAGAATGLAVLVRIEAIVLAPAWAVVLATCRFRPTNVCHGRRRALAAAYGLGLAATASVYALLAQAPAVDDPVSPSGIVARAAGASPLPNSSLLEITLPGEERLCFAPKDPTISIRRRGWATAPVQVCEKLAKAFAYLPGLLAIAGLWSLRRRPASPADRLLQVFALLLVGGIFLHTAREGYLSARHLLPLCVVAAACMGQGVEIAASVLARVLGRSVQPRAAAEDGPRRHPRLAAAIVVCLAAIFVVEGTKPVHRVRSGHRLAAGWLAKNASIGQSVVDTQGLTGLYSGLPTIPYAAARHELERDRLSYVVVEDQELQRSSPRSRTLNFLLATAGRHVAAFPATRGLDRETIGVSIYRWDAGRIGAASVKPAAGSPARD